MRYRIQLATWCLVALAAFGIAQGDANLRRDVDAIAKAIKEKRDDQAKKQAVAFAKANAIDDMMHLYKPAPKGGLGIGPAANPVAPNGIEKAIQDLSKGNLAPAAVIAKPEEFTEMAWRMVALADVTAEYAPKANQGKKNKVAWLQLVDASRKGALDFEKAIQAKDAKGIAAAATRIGNACNTCHSVFK